MFTNEKKIFVKNLQEGDIKTKFQIYEKRIRQDKNGNNYIELRLGDRTGKTTARLFFEQAHVQTTFESISKGDVVKLEGQYSESYNSMFAIKTSKIYSKRSKQLSKP